jgi:glycosyltransferase involved in cell wall biosynthesis
LLLPKRLQRQMIFDADDFLKHVPATSEKFQARLKRLLRNRLAAPIVKRARYVWFANPNEQHLRSADTSTLLPNVIALPNPERPRSAPVADRILMVGLWKHAPNLQGLSWFHQTVWPRLKERFPKAELHVVGSYDPAQTSHLTGVTFHGFVEDLATAYDGAQLVIAPILSGGGTQIKVIDALGHGRPLIASQFAHNGFAQDLVDGDHLLTAEGAEQWLERCAWALEHPAEMERIAQAGEARVRERYGVDRLSRVVAETFATLRPHFP